MWCSTINFPPNKKEIMNSTASNELNEQQLAELMTSFRDSSYYAKHVREGNL